MDELCTKPTTSLISLCCVGEVVELCAGRRPSPGYMSRTTLGRGSSMDRETSSRTYDEATTIVYLSASTSCVSYNISVRPLPQIQVLWMDRRQIPERVQSRLCSPISHRLNVSYRLSERLKELTGRAVGKRDWWWCGILTKKMVVHTIKSYARSPAAFVLQLGVFPRSFQVTSRLLRRGIPSRRC